MLVADPPDGTLPLGKILPLVVIKNGVVHLKSLIISLSRLRATEFRKYFERGGLNESLNQWIVTGLLNNLAYQTEGFFFFYKKIRFKQGNVKEKSCIRETPTLSTNADSRIDTNLKRLRDLSDFFLLFLILVFVL